MSFSEKVQRLRKLNNLSQEQLAEKLNVSRQAISKWEMGAMPDMDNVIKISNFFDCSLDYLLNDQVTELNAGANQKPMTEPRKVITPERLCSWVSIFSIFTLGILWIVSKFVDIDIHRQDTATGNWYVGFSGFVEYYGLRGLVYVLVGMLLSAMTVRTFFQGCIQERFRDRKYLVCSILTWVLYIMGVAAWAYITLHPWKFIWSMEAYIVVALYLMVTIAGTIVKSNIERRGER